MGQLLCSVFDGVFRVGSQRDRAWQWSMAESRRFVYEGRTMCGKSCLYDKGSPWVHFLPLSGSQPPSLDSVYSIELVS
jgi:hypothetical protein